VTIVLQFYDSATGMAVQPECGVLGASAAVAGAAPVRRATANAAGAAEIELGPEDIDLAVSAPGYRPVTARVAAWGNAGNTGAARPVLRFWLDPLSPPPELAPERLAAARQPDTTRLLGFVVDDATGRALPDVEVLAEPSGGRTFTDERGFFALHVPATGTAEVASAASGMLLVRPGYRAEWYRHLELWPGGDWTYRVRLVAGDGVREIDERQFRRRAPSTPAPGTPAPVPTQAPGKRVAPPESGSGSASVSAPVAATVRLPRNIRVLRSDNATVDYVALDYYCRHVLPAEWIASWASYPGGSNSLNAGAVAVRTYAIGSINNPRSSTYDICATTSCQVYGNATSSATDAAVAFTTDQVLVSAGGAIPAGLTEYSAENNQLGAGCGDGFTAPTAGCLYDPVCAGESTFGHGRGLCQWGSARWATGRRMAGRASGDGTATGYPRRDWVWILRHYYPDLTLAAAAPLAVGDPVKALRNVNVRRCADGGIASGINCPAVVTKSAGATGWIVGGPERVTADAAGWTWYRVGWGDVTGWSVENYLDRVLYLPAAPTALTAAGVATNRIELGWIDRAADEAGFAIERAPTASGPWIRLATVAANATRYTDVGLASGATWFYRVLAFNPAGSSAPAGPASATTDAPAPVLPPVADRLVLATVPAALTNTASSADWARVLADFAPFASETANGKVLFRNPRYSTATSAFLDAAPDLAAVTDTHPTAGHGTGCVLRVDFSVGAAANPWLRLTTDRTLAFPNPVIDLRQRLEFDLYADRAVRVALGCRETATTGGTPPGADGGITGAIEWVGITGTVGGAPVPTRTVPAGVWTTLVFDLPREPARSCSGGDNVLWTPSGLGVLEHLAIVPAAGPGRYVLFIDRVAVRVARHLTFSLGPDAPPGARLDPETGVLAWTPPDVTQAATNRVAIRVADDSLPPRVAEAAFAWVVVPRPALAAAPTGAGVVLSWNTVAGARYRVQAADRWPPTTGWSDASPAITAAGPTATWSDPAGGWQRYYRVEVRLP
jgi:hypothetical protein